jgi:D-alanyl-D-alanine carboxypeptidase
MLRRAPRLVAVAAVVAVGSTTTAGASSAPPAATSASGPPLSQVLRAERTEHRVPGMQAAYVDGVSITTATAGVRKLGSGDPVRCDHYFHLASQTKAVTATAIASLVEQRRLRWSSTPAEVFPRLAASMHPTLRDVTLTQLLAHRAGIRPYLYPKAFDALPDWTGTPTERRRAFALWLLRRPPAYEPGSFHYSNAGYTIAMAMATRVSRLSWKTLLVDRVLEPLGMSSWRFGWPAGSDPRQPWGHLAVDGALHPLDPHAYPRFRLYVGPAADLSLTVADYGRFLRMHLLGLRGHDTVLRADTVRRLHEPIGHYALGWGVTEVDGVPTSTHAGTMGSFYAEAVIQPSRGVAVAAFANAGEPRGSRAATDVILRMLDRPSA